MNEIASVLTPDLLKPRWRGMSDNPLFGHCYAASEALYHRLGGKASGWTPTFIRHQGSPHWFLRHESGRIADVTAGQFAVPVPYEKAQGKGFLTKRPSKRAAEILRRIDAKPKALAAFTGSRIKKTESVAPGPGRPGLRRRPL